MDNSDARDVWYSNWDPTVFSLKVNLEGHQISASTFLGVICRENGRYDIIRKSDRKVLCRNIKHPRKLVDAVRKYAEDIAKKEVKNIEKLLLG